MSGANALSIVNIIATKYDMKIEIDFANQVISFTGNYNKETGLACAKEIAKVFG